MLRIETGRHHKTKLEVSKRIGLHCNSNRVDDQIYVLPACSYHSNGRCAFFSNIGIEQTDASGTDMFVRFVKDKSENTICKIWTVPPRMLWETKTYPNTLSISP